MTQAVAIPTGHGGVRPGAGAKKRGRPPGSMTQNRLDEKPVAVVPPQITTETLEGYAKSRARVEQTKALNAELHYRIKLGEYVSIEGVKAASAMAMSMFAQRMRSLPDDIERKFNASPEIIQAISDSLDEALTDLAKSFELMGGGG